MTVPVHGTPRHATPRNALLDPARQMPLPDLAWPSLLLLTSCAAAFATRLADLAWEWGEDPAAPMKLCYVLKHK